MKKSVTFLRDVDKHGITATIGTTFDVAIISMGIVGGFERYNSDNTMEGELCWSALVEFESGNIVPLQIDYDVKITGE